MDASARRAIVQQMLGARQWSAADVEQRLNWCLNPAYWEGLLTSASSGRFPPADEESPVADAAIASEAASLLADGYCRVPRFIGPEHLRLLNASLDVVTAHGWPSTFAWVFDAMWAVTRAASLRRLVGVTLGAGAKQIPHVWVHVVTGPGGRGWPPHVDGVGDRDPRARLSVWIALTDADVDRGCMYVLARSAAPVDPGTWDWPLGNLSEAAVVGMLEGTSALPARAGSALAWNFDVLHWGSVCRGADCARRSLSIEFVADGAALAPDERPLLSYGAADPLPTLTERLSYIARALLEYNRREPAMLPFAPFAEALLTRIA